MIGHRLLFPALVSIGLSVRPAAAVDALPDAPPGYSVAGLQIAGAGAVPESKLRKCMITRPSSRFKKAPYVARILEGDLRSLMDCYRDHGYWEAEVENADVRIDSLKKKVRISIRVSEGRPSRIGMISIAGNAAFRDSLIIGWLPLSRGGILKRSLLDESRNAILRNLSDRGYIDSRADIDFQINAETAEAFVRIRIEEGPPSLIGAIQLPPLEKTRASVVLRELTFQSGDTVRVRDLLESQRKLYLTGLFESVFIRPADTTASNGPERDMILELKEKKSGEFNVSVGYGYWEKVRGGMELFNTNTAGTARKFGVSLKGSFKYWGAECSFSEPWTFGRPFRTDVIVRADRTEEPGYDVERFGGRVTVGRRWRNGIRLSGQYINEASRLVRIRIDPVPAALTSYIHSIGLTAGRDTRDNPFNPGRGSTVEFRNELAGGLSKKSASFGRSTLIARIYVPAAGRTVLASALEIGWVGALNPDREIPLNERFYAGDASALRGFPYKTAGPLDRKRVPLGGKFKLVWNAAEWRVPVYRMVSAAVFWDVGNVWADAASAGLKGMRHTAGFGARAATPVGVLRLDLGFIVDRRDREPGMQVIFNMGQAF
ncbi:BamA/TamA family outer membrane protein [bacterium]|nr:BamA/TamA family outer membrane protein [bacterium]